MLRRNIGLMMRAPEHTSSRRDSRNAEAVIEGRHVIAQNPPSSRRDSRNAEAVTILKMKCRI